MAENLLPLHLAHGVQHGGDGIYNIIIFYKYLNEVL